MGALLLAAAAAAHLLPPRYRAAALVKAEWEDGGGTEAPGQELARRRLDRVRQWVVSDSAARTVLAETRARQKGAPLPGEIEALRSTVGIKGEGPGAFLIESVQPDPGRAAFVSNRLASLLVAEADRQRATRSEGDPRRLETRLSEARKLLEEKEAATSRWGKRRSGSPAPAGDAVGTRLRHLEAQRRAAATGSSAARERAARLEQAIVAESQTPVAEGETSDELARLRAELGEARRRYTAQHPDVEALTRRIRRLEAQTTTAAEPAPGAESERLRSELSRVEAEIEELDGASDRLEAEIARLADLERRSKGGGAPEQDLAGLTRDLEQSRAVYQSLLEEWHAAQRAWQLGTPAPPRLEILEGASVPPRPYFPNRRLFGLAGLTVGLVLGLWSALEAERRDPSVRGPGDLQALLPQPVLAVVPLLRVPRRARGWRASIGERPDRGSDAAVAASAGESPAGPGGVDRGR